ncbi:MAG: IS1595 family transposase [Pseudomonadota bacterium]
MRRLPQAVHRAPRHHLRGKPYPRHKWLQAIFLKTSRKRGVSSNQLHRTLEITLKSASFLIHSIREAMRTDEFDPMGGGGGIVETNETSIGTTDEARAKRARSKNPRAFNFHGGGGHKNVVLTLVDRTDQSRRFHVDKATKAEILPILRENLDGEVRVIADESGIYYDLSFEGERTCVNHSRKERGRGELHANTVQGFYSVFKRGMRGVYQH